MRRAPAVIVHGFADIETTLAAARAQRLPVTLLSAPGAALYAGCLWWRELTASARRQAPELAIADILDCGEAPGRAMEALRIGQRAIVLADHVPAFPAVSRAAAALGAEVIGAPPPALDLAEPGARRRLAAWLGAGPA